MKQEIVDIWIPALESGEYPKTTGALRIINDDIPERAGYCCLGVLCDLYIKETGNGGWIIRKFILGGSQAQVVQFQIKGEKDLYTGNLPKQVLIWAGMYDSSGHIRYTNTVLANVNDNTPDFTEVVKLIRENVAKL